MLECKFALSGVSRVRLAEDGMPVAGNDLARLESGPDVFLDGFVGGVFADLGLHFAEPDEDFLVGEPGDD